MLIPIENDLFDISSRLREIDGDYFIVYNTRRGCYEVHHKGQREGTFCLTVPYGELDSRTVELVKSTRREYMDNVIREIERNNAKLEGRSP